MRSSSRRRVSLCLVVVVAAAVLAACTAPVSPYVPPNPLPPAVATEIAVGSAHACAITTDTTVRCWGYNAYGQLGNGYTYGLSYPAEAIGISGATRIAAGEYHSCAIVTGGEVWCWGYNVYGQLGNGSNNDRAIPVKAVGITGAIAIDATFSNTCALIADGTVKCWGGLIDADPTTATYSNVPVDNVVVPGAVDLQISSGHGCLLMPDGRVECWGGNISGQLGDGTTIGRTNPSEVVGLNDATGVTVDGGISCATRATGPAQCWGQNRFGGLGDGTVVDRLVPVDFGDDEAQRIDTNGSITCAVTGGTVNCAGWNANGELNRGYQTPEPFAEPVPAPVIGVTGAAALGVHSHGACVLSNAGAVSCFGIAPPQHLPSGPVISLP